MDNEESDENFGFDLREEEDVFGFLFVNDNDDKTETCTVNSNSENDASQETIKPWPEEKRNELVTHKAGFDGVDQVKVNKILKRLEESSPFGQLKAKKDAELQEKIEDQRRVFERLQAQDLTFAKSRVELCINKMEEERDLSKYIVCVDMDAYYASVEERDDPTLVEKPMGVGDSAMLCTANYTARKFGVRSAMPGYFAEALCPQIIIVKPNFEKYTAVSQQIRTIFARYDPNFSAMSLDEAFLDITNYAQSHNQSPDDVVQQIRDEIRSETKLNASAGIAANKLLAKVCAEVNKPNGQFRLDNDKSKILEFLRNLPVRKICGIGKVSAKILNGVLDIHTCGELLDKLVYVNMMFSEISFNFYMRISLGIGSSGISTNYTRKSMSTSRTFKPTNNVSSLYENLRYIAEELARRLDQENMEGKTVSVIFKKQSFEQFTRQKALTRYISSRHDLYSYSRAILDKEIPISLRLLGIRITSIRDKDTSNVFGVKRYFTVGDDDNGKDISLFNQIVDEPSISNPTGTPFSSITSPVQDSSDIKNKGEWSHSEQSLQQENIYPALDSWETNSQSCNVSHTSKLLHNIPHLGDNAEFPQHMHQLKSNIIGCQDNCFRKPKGQSTSLSQHYYVIQNNISPLCVSKLIKLQDVNVSPKPQSSNMSSENLAAEIQTPLPPILDDIDPDFTTNTEFIGKPSIPNNSENVLIKPDENFIESKVNPNTMKVFNSDEEETRLSNIYEPLTPNRKRIAHDQGQTQPRENDNESNFKTNPMKRKLWNSEDDDRSSELLTPKKHCNCCDQEPDQLQTQFNNNQIRVENTSTTHNNAEFHNVDLTTLDNHVERRMIQSWDCPICGRYFDNPTRMRINRKELEEKKQKDTKI
ncbi:13190_t:CDS:2 [Funneliformis geosporum]|uniref:DNA polymerase kappa n=1 Tax=Funneliformis geosporum TaxID=1117311 RepID=A0A9W4SZH2_9GLOM|nr:13190_t:CDS:2 [Funneliformis geosporum]CAI2184803.1 6559_t:CDS:2 [Funneliformis geosporum]